MSSHAAETSEVTTLLRRELARRRRITGIFQFGIPAALLLVGALDVFGWLAAAGIDAGNLIWLAIFASGISVSVGAGLRQAMTLSAQLRSKSSLGPLLDTFSTKNADVQELAAIAIKAILPTVRREDRELLEGREDVLHGILKSTRDPDMATAIVTALRATGDASAIPTLERFVGGANSLDKEQKDNLQNLARLALADIRMDRAREIIVSQSGAARSQQ